MKTSANLLRLTICVCLLISLLTGCNRGPSDEALTQSVQAKIKAEPALATQPITVATASAVVTLAGEVTSAANNARAEELAKGVEGVKSVVNNITVKVPVPVIAQDDPLKTQVMANLTKYGITGVTVTVANGEVTLTGNLPRAKLQDAMKAANEAHPKKVNNKLTIQ